jgi:hypothetical protein
MYGPHEQQNTPVIDERPVCPKCYESFLLKHVGLGYTTTAWTKEGSDYHRKKMEYKSTYTECDCGCNTPVASDPESMLRFLAGRLEFAGVSEFVAALYARDIRKILEEYYEPTDKTEE